MDNKTDEFGAIYLAFGAPYLAMALNSVASLRVFNPSVPVCILTNVVDQPPETTWWKSVPGSHWLFFDRTTDKNRDFKTHIYDYSPFHKSVYIDCDTLVLSDVTDLSLFLDYFDVLLKPSERPGKTDRNKKILGSSFPYSKLTHFNGGVLGFRKAANVKQFFDCWRTRYNQLNFRRDQPSLVEALFYSDVRIFPLRRKWNCSDRWYAKNELRLDVAIWHYKTRMDRHLEHQVMRAVDWFSDNPQHLQDVKAFILQQRVSRKHRGLKWMVRSLFTEMRGPLSKLPERHIGSVANPFRCGR
jgi:hypothetical protein